MAGPYTLVFAERGYLIGVQTPVFRSYTTPRFDPLRLSMKPVMRLPRIPVSRVPTALGNCQSGTSSVWSTGALEPKRKSLVCDDIKGTAPKLPERLPPPAHPANIAIEIATIEARADGEANGKLIAVNPWLLDRHDLLHAYWTGTIAPGGAYEGRHRRNVSGRELSAP